MLKSYVELVLPFNGAVVNMMADICGISLTKATSGIFTDLFTSALPLTQLRLHDNAPATVRYVVDRATADNEGTVPIATLLCKACDAVVDQAVADGRLRLPQVLFSHTLSWYNLYRTSHEVVCVMPSFGSPKTM